MKILNKEFEVFLNHKELESIVQRMADLINEFYSGKKLVIIGVLNGSFIFVSDLVRLLTIDLEIKFVKYRSYVGTHSGDIYKEIPEESDLNGRHALVLEDIVDTGQTISHLAKDLKALQPHSLTFGTLLLKEEVYHGIIPLQFVDHDIHFVESLFV